jgi:lipoyl(octanoyl) transferase
VEEKSPVHPDRATAPIVARWLGRIAYRDAWAFQRALATARQADRIPDQLLLLEHPPVITLGRNATQAHVIAPAPLLAERGIEVIRVERGGEVTYHGPGQLVAYPLVGLAGHRLGVRAFVEALEGAMADACAAASVSAGPRAGHPGCWCDPAGPLPRKIGALGIRVSRGVSLHGIALNVATDLADFGLIDPCGMPGLTTTSIARELGDRDARPSTSAVGRTAADFAVALARRLGSTLEGSLPPGADPVAERRALESMVAGLAGGSGDVGALAGPGMPAGVGGTGR